MAATQSYVITVGTTPVPESRWARRRMRYEARHRRDTTVLSATGQHAAPAAGHHAATGQHAAATGQGRHRRSGTPAEKTVSDVTSPSAWFASARHAAGSVAAEDSRTPANRGAHRAPADPDQAPRYTTAYAPGATAYAALGHITADGEWEADEPDGEGAPAPAASESGRVRRFGVRPRPGRAGTRPDGARPRSTARVRTEPAEPAAAHRSPARHAMPDGATESRPSDYRTGPANANVRPRGAHRASEARPGGRHRASGPGRRSYSARHGRRPAQVVARSGLTALVLLMLVATFVSAWFTATGAAAFANIVRP